VLETLREVYRYDAGAEQGGLTPEERLKFHQQHSQPVMDALHAWFEAQFNEKKVEPNSGLGEAITHCLKHWERLTLFPREAGAPLDSNMIVSGGEDGSIVAGPFRTAPPTLDGGEQGPRRSALARNHLRLLSNLSRSDPPMEG